MFGGGQHLITITDGRTDTILDDIDYGNFWSDNHHKSLKDNIETFDFTTFADKSYSQHLTDKNRIVIPDEDGTFIEFEITNSHKYHGQNGLTIEVYTSASYLSLQKAKVIRPQKLQGATAKSAAQFAVEGTEFEVGEVHYAGIRTINIERHTNPFALLKRIAREFNLELRFRVVKDSNKIVKRYVDMFERVGEWQGREVEFGKDLISIERKEDTSNIVTALIGLGPEREDDTRLEVFVEDKEALQRWGRRNPKTGELMHIVETYEPQSEDTEMTESRLRELTKNELEKRVNALVEYVGYVSDLEKVPGLEHEKFRFGDTIKLKDTSFNPPLYLEARIHTQDRPLSDPSQKKVTLGDFIELSEEEVFEVWKALQQQINERLSKMVIVNIVADGGIAFKNGQGSTDLKAVTYLQGQEVDSSGLSYEYTWQVYDKNGNLIGTSGGKQFTVYAKDIDEKSTYIVTVSDGEKEMSSAVVTVTNVYDGKDGYTPIKGVDYFDGKDGQDGQSSYLWVRYSQNANGSNMTTDPTNAKYIGIATTITPNAPSNPSDYNWALIKGQDGVPGPPGKDGQPTYTWVKYADDDKGSGMSDSPDGKLYIGLAFNKTTPHESNNPADYTWSLMPQNIEIGGRNLLRNTSDEWTILQLSDSQYYFQQGTDTRLEVGVTYTFSILVEKVSDDDVPIRVNIGTGIKGNFQRDKGLIVPVEFGKKFALTFTITENDIANGYEYFAWRLRNEKQETTIRFKEVKLEKGNVATDWTPAPEDIEAEIEKAKQDAQNAQMTADGKNTVFYQDTKPSLLGRKEGDLWFKTNEGYKPFRFNGSDFVEATFGHQAIANITAGQIIADDGSFNWLEAKHIKSLNGLDVGNGQFKVDSNGNVSFGGSLDGANGTFRGIVEIVDPNDDSDYPSGTRIDYSNFVREIYDAENKKLYVMYITNGIVLDVYDTSGANSPGPFYTQSFSFDANGLSFYERGSDGKMELKSTLIPTANGFDVDKAKIENVEELEVLNLITSYKSRSSIVETDRLVFKKGVSTHNYDGEVVYINGYLGWGLYFNLGVNGWRQIQTRT